MRAFVLGDAVPASELADGLLEVDATILAADLLPRVRELVVIGFLRRLSD